jgi:hypothetical protein
MRAPLRKGIHGKDNGVLLSQSAPDGDVSQTEFPLSRSHAFPNILPFTRQNRQGALIEECWRKGRLPARISADYSA